MRRILVAGNINIETGVRIDAFPLPYRTTTFVPFGIGSRPSAVGYNIARALHTLGDQVALLSIIGRDPAAALIRASLAADGIDDRSVLGLIDHTPQSVILYDAHGQRHALVDLKNVLEQPYPADRFVDAARGCAALILSNIAYCRALLPVAHTLELPIATDVHTLTDLDDPYNLPFLRAASVLFMSGERLPEPPEAWARRVLDRFGAQIVVIGLGERGALLARRAEDSIVHVPAVTTRPVVSTGGAGDALLAAFMHSYIAGADAEIALRKATLFSSYKIGAAASSAGFLDQATLDQMFAEHRAPG